MAKAKKQLDPLRDIRAGKLGRIRKLGANPFPSVARRSQEIKSALASFDSLAAKKDRLFLAGRIRSIREHGGSTFFHFEDGTGRIQGYVKKDAVGEKRYRDFLDFFDIGDIAEFSGELFATKRGEKTLLVFDFRMLAKSLRPLPDKWHGLQDVEERFRKRYLDLLMNQEVRMIFETRSKIAEELRKFLYREGFMEVETPILQSIPGGARAKPFKTKLNALSMNLFLRVAPELYLKRLLVGGFEKVFEIGRCFRNEGMDATHNPDFTQMELYAAYRDYQWMMEFIERLLSAIIIKIFGKSGIIYEGNAINFAPPFERIEFDALVKKHTGIDVWNASEEEIRKFLKSHQDVMEKKETRANLLDELYKEFCKKNIIQPTYVLHLPIELNPLAKMARDPRKAERFQLVAGGIELVNAFSELNDPEEQERRLREEIKQYPEQAKRLDRDFLEALEYGMPPAAGMGMGIDRLVMLLTNSHAIREVILFPTMRPKKTRSKQ